jgi:hypothetical protein
VTQTPSEARRNESERSKAAHFSSVLSKPFDIDELLRVVALAVNQSPFRTGHERQLGPVVPVVR